MLKVSSSRADLVGQMNSLEDSYSFSNADAFNRLLVPENAKPALTIMSDEGEAVKDLHDFHYELDITSKTFMLDRGFVSLPTMEYNARLGALEARELSNNPLADEGNVNVVVGGSFSGNIDTTGDTDDIRVFLVTGQVYHISLRGTGATPVSDTFLEVYNPSAALVNFDDDGGIGTNSMLTFTATATGNYIIRASSFSNPGQEGTGGYTVDVRVQGADAVGDTNATAVGIAINSTTFGFRETATVSGGADLDRYEVQLEAGKFYTFKLAAGADYATDYTAVPAGEIDTILRLRNAAGTLVAQNDDISFPGDISSGLSFLAQTTGTYYVDVTGYAGQTGGYALEVQNIIYQDEDPLQSIRWVDADNIDTVDVNGTPTAYVYFGLAGETFGETGLPNTWGWTAKEKAAVMSALLEYTKITGITYLETNDVNQAEFRLQTVSGPNPPVSYGAYFYPQDPAYGTQQGIGVFNVNSGGWDKPGVSTQDIPGDQVSLDKGGFSYAVILHEFGHAHGVAHPHDNGGGSDIMLGVVGATGSYGIFDLNQGVYTVMSYNDAWDFHPDGPSPFTIAGISNGWSGTLGAFDIAVLQERYGVHAYATGDDVYTISATQAGTYYSTIWDTGGTDSIVYNGTGNARIDLTAATLDYSPTGGGVLSFVDQIPGTAGADGIWGGFTIANGVVIENARGGSGVDTLIGNAADNELNGNGGADTMSGRGGNDRYFVDNAGDVIIEAAGDGANDRVLASVSYALAAGVFVEVLSTTDNFGTTAINLTGNANADTIYGNNGANELNGLGGADYMNGFGGDDRYFVDNAGDVVVEVAGGGSNDRILTSVSYTLGAGVAVEVLSTTNNFGTTAINLTGNANADTIYGNDGANIIDGRGGADYMVGFGGNDFYFVDNAADIIVEGAGGGTLDRVYSSVNYTLGAGVQVEYMATDNHNGTATVNLTGNELGQTILGNFGNNFLDGGDGADYLDAGYGTDQVRGGNGADIFAFTYAPQAGSVATILDFGLTIDKIGVKGVSQASLAAGAFNTGTAATEADDRIIYDQATGRLFFDADGTGATAAIHFATVTAFLPLTANDFTTI